MNAAIIIPAFQPENNLMQIVDRLWNLGNQIIVVDDGSTEDKKELFHKISEIAIVIHQEKNRGKGAAIKKALNYIKENIWDCDVIGVMDADGQHLPEDMEKLLIKARHNDHSIVLGVRNISKEIPLKSKIGNEITRMVFRMLSGVTLTDMQTGLRAFSKSMIERFLEIEGTRYEYETNVLLTCAKEKIPIIEVPIRTIELSPTEVIG
jgi:Glycosyltransferases involved in cell wall biogenesis